MALDRNALLRDRFVNGTGTNLLFTVLVAVVTVWLMWQYSPHGPLLFWAALLSGSTGAVSLFRLVDMEFDRWFRGEVIMQAANGISWGLVAVIAMPSSIAHQALLAAVLSCVLVASSAGESQFRLLYASFMGPLSATTLVGYCIHPRGLTAAAVFFVITILFAVSSSAVDRTLHHRVVDMMIENEALMTKLEQDHQQLATLNQRLDRLAWTDSLTGLANRAAATRHLDNALVGPGALDSPVIVAYLDLNGFKQINDQLGHGVGDKLLAGVAARLQDRATPTELVCRLGGDELIVISRSADAGELAGRLASAFDDRFTIDGHELAISSAIGVAVATERGSADELLKEADQALYENKRNPGNQEWELWAPERSLDDGRSPQK